jgi:hypothetical protein
VVLICARGLPGQTELKNVKDEQDSCSEAPMPMGSQVSSCDPPSQGPTTSDEDRILFDMRTDSECDSSLNNV